MRWKRELGEGYSGIAVRGTTLYTMHRREPAFWQILMKPQQAVVPDGSGNGILHGPLGSLTPGHSPFSGVRQGTAALRLTVDSPRARGGPVWHDKKLQSLLLVAGPSTCPAAFRSGIPHCGGHCHEQN